MDIYDKNKAAKELLAWAKKSEGHCYYLEDRIYAVADNGTVILLEASSAKEAIRKARRMRTQVNQYGNNATNIGHVETLNI